MSTVRDIRLALGVSQEQLAEGCGVKRQAISRVEQGWALPSPELAARVETVLECGPVLCTADLFSDWPTRPYQFPRVNPEFWQVALTDWAYPVSQLRIEKRTFEWMQGALACESADEAYTLLQIAGLGAQPQVSNPHAMGFRDIPIVDVAGKALGERALPGLVVRLESMTFLIWPQVRLKPGRTPYRPDALVALRRGQRVVWCTLEVDGRGHDPARNDFRQTLLGLKEIRVSYVEVKNHQAASRFVSQALDLLAPVLKTAKASR